MSSSSATATVAQNLIAVEHTSMPSKDLEYLTVRCPEGWDDVKKLLAKVLLFEGRQFTFSGWNSDQNVAYFHRSKSANRPSSVATIL